MHPETIGFLLLLIGHYGSGIMFLTGRPQLATGDGLLRTLTWGALVAHAGTGLTLFFMLLGAFL